MSPTMDKVALLLAAAACAAGAWVILHFSGQWFFPVVTIVAVVCLYVDNRKLRATLRAHGIDPQAAKSK